MERVPAEVFIEFHRVGNAVKVSAMDSESLVEVSVMGAATTPPAVLERAALRKLAYVLAKRSSDD
jgi:hypothetical protein